MPSRNIVRTNIGESYYHVYARGASKQPIFLDKTDYVYFLSLLKRYLGKKQQLSKTGVAYPNYHDEVKLLAYCLMKNHFHIYLYQSTEGGIARFMKSLMTSYSRYFNIKYKRSGSLFESRYKAVRTSSQTYHEHITRYIHLNPRYWKRYPYSSLDYYTGKKESDWISPDKILEQFTSVADYLEFLENYEQSRDELAELKYELADN